MGVKHLILTYDEINDFIEIVRDKGLTIDETTELIKDIEIIRALLKKLEELCRGVYILFEEEEIPPEQLEVSQIKHSELRSAIEELKRYIDRKIEEIKSEKR